MDRQSMKFSALKVIKKHYFIYVAACMIAAIIGAEFREATMLINSKLPSYNSQEALSYYSDAFLSQDNMYDFIVKDYNQRQMEQLDKLTPSEKNSKNAQIFARQHGVFATAINGITSGSFLSQFLISVRSMTGSDNIAVFLLILVSMIWLFIFWFYIKNVFPVVIRRLFLEGRIYAKLPFQRYLFLVQVRKWHNASLVMFYMSVLKILWWFTIIGGIVKHYSYLMVPYIVAENPGISCKNAINLSKQMMKNHKLEYFLNDCTFIGWFILGIATFGLSDAVFTNAYRTAYFTECYLNLRTDLLEIKPEYGEFFIDTYLFSYAEKSTLRSYYPEIHSYRKEDLTNPVDTQNGFKSFISKWLGISLFTKEVDDLYNEQQIKKIRLLKYKDEYDTLTYPTRISPLPAIQLNPLIETINYMRRYSFSSIVFMFFIFSGIGWLWEVCFHLVFSGTFVNRGVLHGPWLPIYGFGGTLILVLLYKIRSHPIIHFVSAMTLCGFIEYFTAVYLEYKNNGQGWWDYTGYFLNVNGRICAEGLMIFAIGGCAVVYFVAPILDTFIVKCKTSILHLVCLVLIIAFLCDLVYSHYNPNIGYGITYNRKKIAKNIK